MERTLISESPQKVGKEVRLCGFVSSRRDHGKLIFIDLKDRSGLVQVVGDEKMKDLKVMDAVEIVGAVKKRPSEMINAKIPTGEIEISLKEIKVLSKSEELPLDMGLPELKVELPTLLDYRPLTLRHPKISAIFKVEEVVIDAFRKSLKELGFTEFQAPIIVPATAEGGAEVFPVKYFDHQAFLGQSPQLYKQILLGVFERVFCVTHAFRAEPSMTTRHLTEYISLDAEMAFIDSWEDLMDCVEFLTGKILESVGKECSEELSLYEATIPQIGEKIPRLKLSEAQEIIFKRTKRDNRHEPDLQPADEEEICQWAKEEKGSDFVFITHFPVKKRPFYTFPDPKESQLTLSFDLIGRGLEWVTGGQRINDYQQLVENIKKWGNKEEDFSYYLQAFKYALPAEGGFAMGGERIVMKILGLDNIRQASLFPRDMERIDFRLSKKE